MLGFQASHTIEGSRNPSKNDTTQLFFLQLFLNSLPFLITVLKANFFVNMQKSICKGLLSMSYMRKQLVSCMTDSEVAANCNILNTMSHFRIDTRTVS